ncbi:MAG: AraC family transcriptional regulator [Ruminococcaceae bacterium]|nr:AraC family transcriptional regulator [Oscillospiraceae bacterium]
MKLSNIQHLTSGRFISQGEWIHPERVIDSCEIIFMIKGSFQIAEADKIYQMEPDDVLILDKNTLHRGLDTRTDVSFFWVHFPGRPDDIQLPKHLKLTNPSGMLLLFRQLLNYSNTPQYPRFASDLILRLILTEINVQYVHLGDDRLALVNEICEWIRINVDKPISADDIASQFHYNKDYLSRLFRRSNLPGLKQTVIQTKIDRARYLLLSTDLPIKDIASCVGYESYLEFLKFYKFHEGVSPSTFRNTYKQTHLNKH